MAERERERVKGKYERWGGASRMAIHPEGERERGGEGASKQMHTLFYSNL